MAEITFLSDSYLFIANFLFLLSYLQKEVLMLRLILISACLFMFLMGLRYPTIFIDGQTFNLIFIVINGYLSFKLFLKLIPPKFTDEETKLYNKYFCRYFKPNEFKKLVGIARRRIYRVNSNIATQGNGFSSIFFVVDIIGDNISLELKHNGVRLKEVFNYGWVGIVEYIDLISKDTLTKAILNGCDFGSWEVGLDVKINILEETEESVTGSQIYEEEEEEELEEEKNDYFEDNFSKITKEVVLYEFDLETLDNLYSDKDDGNAIKNSLHSIWLLYFSEYIYKYDANKKLDSTNINSKKKTGSVLFSDSQLSLLNN